MKVMTALEAKNSFGQFLAAAQREPVAVTRNRRRVATMFSIEDIARVIISPSAKTHKYPRYLGYWQLPASGGRNTTLYVMIARFYHGREFTRFRL